MTTLSVLAVQNASLLRALNVHKPHNSLTGLAEAAGRNVGNLNASLKSLAAAGLIAYADGAQSYEAVLTEGGLEQVRAIGRAESGRDAMLPKGVVLVRRDQIKSNPLNPRTEFDPVEDEALALSIVMRGLLQPPVLRPADADGLHPIHAGERRWRALGLLEARGEWDPARLILCAVRETEDTEALEDALIENLQRSDLHPLDEAEAYRKLADAGRSGTQIERLAPKRRARSIQQYIKVARELSAEDKARMRLPESDARHLSINKAIDLVTDKKAPPPALALSAREALALVEIACAAIWRPAPEIPEPGYTVLYGPPPTGGPIIQLFNKGLVGLRPRDGAVYAKVLAHSSKAGEFLREIGFEANADVCLHQARVKALGELETASLPKGDDQRKFWLAELRLPAPTSAAVPPAAIQPAAPQAQAGVTPQAPSPLATAEPAPALALAPELSADQRLLLIEVADKIERDGVKTAAGVWGCRAASEFRFDTTAQALVSGERMLGFMPGPDGRLVAALTPAATVWFRAQGFLDAGERGPIVTRGDLYDARVAALGEAADAIPDGRYHTGWLNDPEPAAPAEVETDADEPRTPFADEPPLADIDARAEAAGGLVHAFHTGDREKVDALIDQQDRRYESDIGRMVRHANAETAALQRLDAALVQAIALVEKAATRRLNAAEVETCVAFATSAREAARPHLKAA